MESAFRCVTLCKQKEVNKNVLSGTRIQQHNEVEQKFYLEKFSKQASRLKQSNICGEVFVENEWKTSSM